MRVSGYGNMDSVKVDISSFGQGLASGTVTLSSNGRDHTQQVHFPYADTMTAGQMELAALK